MTSSSAAGRTSVLADFAPFDQLPLAVLAKLEARLRPCRFRLGQTILRSDGLPEGVLFFRSGSVRSLAPAAEGEGLRTIERLGPGAIAGWAGLLRNAPCEHLRASTEVEALLLPADDFRALLSAEPAVATWFAHRPCAAELHALLRELAPREPAVAAMLQEWPLPGQEVRLWSLTPGEGAAAAPPDGVRWFASSGLPLGAELSAGQRLPRPRAGEAWLRLIAIAALAPPSRERSAPEMPPPPADPRPGRSATLSPEPVVEPEVLAEDEYSPSPEEPAERRPGHGVLRLARATGPRDIPLAMCLALADYFGLAVNRDALTDQIEAILQRQERLNLMNLGQILDGMGLRVVLSRVPCDRLARVATPAVLLQHGHFGLLDGVDPDGQARLLESELGPLRVPCAELATHGEGLTELLLFERKPGAREQRFSWSWYLPFLRPYRRQIIEVLAASVVINLAKLVFPIGMMVMIQSVMSSRSTAALFSIASVMLLAAIVESLVKTLRGYIFTELANRVDQQTKDTILDRMVRLPLGFFEARPVGQITFYFSQLDRLRDFLMGKTLPTLVDFAFSLLYLVILFLLSPLLTFVALSTLPLLLGLTLLSSPVVRNLINRTMKQAMRRASFLNEAIGGIQTIKAQNAELRTRWEFHDRQSSYIGEDFKLKVTRETIANLAEFIGKLNQVIVMAVSVWLIIQGDFSIGALFAFRILSGYVNQPMVQMVTLWQDLRMNTEALRNVADVVDRPTEQTEEESRNIPLPPLRGDVRFEAIRFRFAEDAPFVLDGVDLHVPAGSFVGVVGGSGSGKSTLLKLLPRFYRPTEGAVRIDDLDIGKVELYSLRRQLGVVPQDPLLFDGSIRDNLLLVKPDANAAELVHACRIACAHDFIMDLPKGYNTDVGERGAGLSGGQRQRIALARAILQNPRLLILDEATSALDANTEKQVCLQLLETFRGRTVFFITHRLATVRSADLIVVMDRGAIVESGTHSQLIEQQGWYYALLRSQKQEGIS